jgi:chromosome segregation ATPase
MGVSEEVAAYNELVSKAVLTFDEDLADLENSVQALEALGQKHEEGIASLKESYASLRADAHKMHRSVSQLHERFSRVRSDLNSTTHKTELLHRSLNGLTSSLETVKRDTAEGVSALERSFTNLNTTVKSLKKANLQTPVGIASAALLISLVALVVSIVA